MNTRILPENTQLPQNWNMNVTVIPFIVGALGTVPKGFEKKVEELKIWGRIETIQTSGRLRPARILRRILEIWGDLLSLSVTRVCVLALVWVKWFTHMCVFLHSYNCVQTLTRLYLFMLSSQKFHSYEFKFSECHNPTKIYSTEPFTCSTVFLQFILALTRVKWFTQLGEMVHSFGCILAFSWVWYCTQLSDIVHSFE